MHRDCIGAVSQIDTDGSYHNYVISVAQRNESHHTYMLDSLRRDSNACGPNDDADAAEEENATEGDEIGIEGDRDDAETEKKSDEDGIGAKTRHSQSAMVAVSISSPVPPRAFTMYCCFAIVSLLADETQVTSASP